MIGETVINIFRAANTLVVVFLLAAVRIKSVFLIPVGLSG